MDHVTVTQADLEQAFLTWERKHREGKTLTAEQSRALPLETVARESAAYLFALLQGKVAA